MQEGQVEDRENIKARGVLGVFVFVHGRSLWEGEGGWVDGVNARPGRVMYIHLHWNWFGEKVFVIFQMDSVCSGVRVEGLPVCEGRKM